ncbi:MAG: GH92 family glycosyl hydrolase [Thermoguttaceae bacterium]
MKTSFSFLFLAAMLLLSTQGFAAQDDGTASTNAATPLGDYVRPLVGTYGEGDTYPGPTAPFGMVQLSPDTDRSLCSGYAYSDPTILGFSMTHLSGTGCADLADFLFMPQVGPPQLTAGDKKNPKSGYQSLFSHSDESASLGYYQVKLLKSGVNVELTCSDRAGMLRMTFPQSDRASILTDLSHVLGKVVWSRVRVESTPGSDALDTVTGFHIATGWGPDRHLYFAAKYSRPFDDFTIFSDGKPVVYNGYRFRSSREAAGANLRFLAKYKTSKDESILVKVGISAISAANAMKNLEAEIPDWDFDRVRRETRAKWETELSKIQIEGSQWDKETLYTGLYHCFNTPNLYQDVTGEYSGLDHNIHQAKGFTNHALYSLWDTFRAEHPLFTLIQAPRDADMINSLLAHYDQSVEHLLPVWQLPSNENWCMIGYHAVPVIVDGYLKGVRGFDPERAYEAVKTTAMNPHYDSVALYDKLGWVPFDKENESVSKTLEYAFDDYCVAQMAKALGKTDDYNHFMRRAASYKNVFDSSTGFMRAKDSHGKWRTPFDPHSYEGGDITEGSSCQYSWFVPQDVPGLIALRGGKEKFAEKLDELFHVSENPQPDMHGFIGEYWHGNEPSHHIIYLYCYAGQPWKAQYRVHQVMKTQYGGKPESLSGNDDCGQMSAWYVFSALGFYPVCPASDYFVIGSPGLKKAEVRLSNGKTLTVTADGLSDKNIYVQSLTVNGKSWNSPFLPHREIRDGGTLVFTMGPEPNKQWGTNLALPE